MFFHNRTYSLQVRFLALPTSRLRGVRSVTQANAKPPVRQNISMKSLYEMSGVSATLDDVESTRVCTDRLVPERGIERNGEAWRGMGSARTEQILFQKIPFVSAFFSVPEGLSDL